MDLDAIPDLPDQRERIAEVLVDTYGEDEQLVAFQTYLTDVLQFPFKATWRDPDEKGHAEQVRVLGVEDANLRQGVLLKVQRIRTRKERRVEAGQIWPQDEKSVNAQVLGDYRHWFNTSMAFEEFEEE